MVVSVLPWLSRTMLVYLNASQVVGSNVEPREGNNISFMASIKKDTNTIHKGGVLTNHCPDASPYVSIYIWKSNLFLRVDPIQ